jgi:hypothetical protein
LEATSDIFLKVFHFAIDEPGSSTGIVLCDCSIWTAGQTSVSVRPSFSVKNIDQNKRLINTVFNRHTCDIDEKLITWC